MSTQQTERAREVSIAAHLDRYAGLVEDVEFLRAAGCAPSEIAGRLGRTAASMEKLLYRHGRADLGRLFARARRGTA